MLSTAALDRTLPGALDSLCSATGWPVAHAFLIDPEIGPIATNIWSSGNQEQYIGLRTATQQLAQLVGEERSLGTGLPRRVATSRQAVWIPDINHDPRFLRRKAGIDLAVRTCLGVPVFDVNETVGLVLECFHHDSLGVDPDVIADAITVASALAASLSENPD